MDFLRYLDTDVSVRIFMRLDDLSDILRASSVSHSWRHFVITSGLCKQFCLRMFPKFSSVACVVEPSCEMDKYKNSESSNSMGWQTLEREHRIYASLGRALTTIPESNCIEKAISASSTDNYPAESILNTLDPRDRINQRASYWSSKGQSDPAVPETLIYKLIGGLCVVTEIRLQPFQAFFQWGLPIYSARSVRFRMGHPKSSMDIESGLMDLLSRQPADDKFIWTYTSQEFPMAQENRLQKFELPEPVLCIGGFLQIELLGRVQKQQMDGLLYICLSHVQVLGRSLFPSFDVEILEQSTKFLLKHYPAVGEHAPTSFTASEPHVTSESHDSPSGWMHRNLQQFLNIFPENAQPDHELVGWDEDYEAEDDDDLDGV